MNYEKEYFTPVILFVFNRLEHTRRVIEALLENEEASYTELFIYSDGARNENDLDSIKAVRDYIHEVHGFKKVTIIERKCNIGLAQNIIEGVTEIINEYGKAIILEDDIVVSPVFLKYMNDALRE